MSDHSYISKNMITTQNSITLKKFSRMALKKQKIRMKKISTYGALIINTPKRIALNSQMSHY